nr:PREDICTED: protein scarlet [Bemisia tabaci]
MEDDVVASTSTAEGLNGLFLEGIPKIAGLSNDENGKRDIAEKSLLKSRNYGQWCPYDEGVTLTWRDLSVYTVVKQQSFIRKSAQTYKRLINNASGAVRAGSLVAMMGASGAGKSTLMAALANRLSGGVIADGDIRVNGRPVGKFMHRLAGFMHQEDLFVDTLTVLEYLTLMAKLKLDRRTSHLTQQQKVSNLLIHLGLTKCANSRIASNGSSQNGLSGGERKRLSFATEMLTDPAILFCDEPTTGLDSYSAQKLVEMMQEMTSVRGKTVICTIHQPSSQLFEMFHEIVLIGDGRIAFIGSTNDALEFFERNGYHCPATYNPADFLIRTLAITPGSEDISHMAVRKICDQFAVSEYAQQVDLVINYELHMGTSYTDSLDEKMRDYKSPFWFSKLYWLTYRSSLELTRDHSIQTMRIFQKILIAVMSGLCFTSSVRLTQFGIQSVQGALFIMVTENTFAPMYAILNYFPRQFPLLNKEYTSGIYPPSVFYLSNLLALGPGQILEPLLFVVIVYLFAGLRSSVYAFGITVLAIVLTMNVSTACGIFFSVAFDSVPIAMSYLVPFDYALMITCGAFIKLSTLPDYAYWIQYISWLMYSYEAMTIVQWNNITNISCLENQPDLPCLENGQEILNKFSFGEDNLQRDILGLVLLYIAFHILGFLCLCKRMKRN